MLSQTAEYALRAVLHIAREARDGPVRVDDVAEAVDVPRNYLSKTLHVLAKRGVLKSTRGPRGGFELAVPAAELPLLSVVDPFDAIEERRECLLGRTRCSDENACDAHAHWKDVSEKVAGFFRDTAVADLLGEDAAVPAVALEGNDG